MYSASVLPNIWTEQSLEETAVARLVLLCFWFTFCRKTQKRRQMTEHMTEILQNLAGAKLGSA